MNDVGDEIWRVGQKQQPEQRQTDDRKPAKACRPVIQVVSGKGAQSRQPGEKEVPNQPGSRGCAVMPGAEREKSEAERRGEAERCEHGELSPVALVIGE